MRRSALTAPRCSSRTSHTSVVHASEPPPCGCCHSCSVSSCSLRSSRPMRGSCQAAPARMLNVRARLPPATRHGASSAVRSAHCGADFPTACPRGGRQLHRRSVPSGLQVDPEQLPCSPRAHSANSAPIVTFFRPSQVRARCCTSPSSRNAYLLPMPSNLSPARSAASCSVHDGHARCSRRSAAWHRFLASSVRDTFHSRSLHPAAK
mmetsp:Transcript_15063/g.50001  ORF Transcript_15063/g.50001 Transcript_15063/m.50001 type:complete len:207 (+) Transcript_15063:363-983(+)